MTFKPCASEYLPVEDQYALGSIRKVMESLPHIELGKDEAGNDIELSCHMLARALSRKFPALRFRDGLFAGIYNHSWLVTQSDNVVDPYPVGILGGPILVDNGAMGPARKLYKSTKERYKGQFSQKSFVKSVSTVTKEVARTMARIGL